MSSGGCQNSQLILKKAQANTQAFLTTNLLINKTGTPNTLHSDKVSDSGRVRFAESEIY